jgi:hypothetical protein
VLSPGPWGKWVGVWVRVLRVELFWGEEGGEGGVSWGPIASAAFDGMAGRGSECPHLTWPSLLCGSTPRLK